MVSILCLHPVWAWSVLFQQTPPLPHVSDYLKVNLSNGMLPYHLNKIQYVYVYTHTHMHIHTHTHTCLRDKISQKPKQNTTIIT